ncbi:hypothetical protein O6H91_21G034100 [Diphasiastrum complanatum]|uniref:Uncharacterized protein n=1 Tax=Diphasiastrum complanatum TaxID=34168 RepID=A0ACC2AJC3_DIPCM|nr:hypothetical protein O6H91_21G034100 [Diphasiastrum complanatum]
MAMAMAMASATSLNAAMAALAVGGFSSSSIMGTPAYNPRSSSLPLKKRWEKKEVKPNSLPVVRKMHVKVGDTVKIIAGSDKGKISEVSLVYTHNSNVLVKNVNLKTKHVKGKAEGESGQIIQVEAPIHSSNVMLYSKTAKVASRVGHKVVEDGRKVRYLLKTGEVLDSPEDWKRLHKKENKEEKKSLAIV